MGWLPDISPGIGTGVDGTTSRGVGIDPGDLDAFAERVGQIADDWVAEQSYPVSLLTSEWGESGNPSFGLFEEAAELAERYHTAFTGFSQNVLDLANLLEGLAEASRQIAENYRNTEALNEANVAEIDQILATEITLDSIESGTGGGPTAVPSQPGPTTASTEVAA